MNETKLKPCPFCGGEALAMMYRNRGAYTVCCAVCNSRTAEFANEEAAIKAWNKRSTT